MTTSLLLSAASGPALGIGPGFISVARAQTPPAADPTPPTTGQSDPVKPEAPAQTPQGPQPSPEEVDAAKRHFESGVDFFQRGNYTAARAEFEAAYALTKYPQLLFNLGKTAEKLNLTADAVRYLEGYLASNPSESDVTEVRAKLVELRKQSAATPATSSQPSAPPGKLPPVPALALMGAGAGLLIIGIGCGAGALAAAGSFTPGSSVPYSKYTEGKALDAAGIAFDVIGGAALAAGVAWTGYWAYQRSKASKQQQAAISLIPLGAGLGVAGQF